jgi:hypothetical protein
LTTVWHSAGIGVEIVAGNVDEIDDGTTTVDGIWMTVKTVDGNDGNSVTGTKTTVDGTQVAGIDVGVETWTDVGIETDDGNWVIWIGINVDGIEATVTGGNVDWIDGGTWTDVGIWITVKTVDGNDGNSVTGTKMTVDGTHVLGTDDGAETWTDVGIVTDDGNWVIWIGIKVDGIGATVTGNVDEIDDGTLTVDGIWITVKTDDGNDGNSVTGTKTTVDGTHVAGIEAGVET